MMNNKISPLFFTLLIGFSQITLAEDITGLWQSIDDKTGNVKTTVEIRPDTQGIYTGIAEFKF